MPEHSSATQAPVSARALTPLLTRITQESLDEDYVQAAARRRVAEASRVQDGQAPRVRRPGLVAGVVVAAFGLMVAIAAAQTSERSGVESASRRTLVDQITDKRAEVADLQRRIVALRERNVGLELHLGETTDDLAAAQARVQRLGAQTGFGPVVGPGVTITVKDATNGEAVRADDLALLVDGLWNVGAEAISINGKRLTARSALFNSGPAINLNGSPPLSPPYVVSAIGDNTSMQADLLGTSSGLEFTSVAKALGFGVSMENVGQMTLPAAPQRLLHPRYAVAGTAAENSKHRKEIAP